jgi:hypothetical protein
VRPLRKLLQHSPFYSSYKSFFHYPDYLYWKLRPHPKRSPHLVKQRALLEYAKRFHLRILVETGTYYGEMVAALKNRFDRIESVECDPRLAQMATRKFAGHSHIHILEGESQELIPRILQSITAPALFWLDAGYYTWDGLLRNKQRLSMELHAILSTPHAHIVLIDDASTLKFRAPDAPEPANVAELQANLAAAFPAHHVEIQHDIVRITPRPLTPPL